MNRIWYIHLFLTFQFVYSCSDQPYHSTTDKHLQEVSTDDLEQVQAVNQEIDFVESRSQVYRNIEEALPNRKLSFGGAALIDDNYAVAVYTDSVKPEYKFLIFEQVFKTNNGQANYSILDSVWIHFDYKTDYLAYGCCMSGSSMDKELVGVCQDSLDVEYFTNISAAWRLNRQIGRIEVIDTDSISCVNEGFGI